MEIVKVDLAASLKFVCEIEKTEGECSARPGPGGREQPNAKKLNSSTDRWSRTTVATETISDPHGMYARDIKKSEIHRSGGERARIVNVVTKLIGQAQVEEGLPGEELPVPLLREIFQRY